MYRSIPLTPFVLAMLALTSCARQETIRLQSGASVPATAETSRMTGYLVRSIEMFERGIETAIVYLEELAALPR